MTEGYREFLDRVHRGDVEKGKALHKEGVCRICDELHHQKVGLSREREQ